MTEPMSHFLIDPFAAKLRGVLALR